MRCCQWYASGSLEWVPTEWEARAVLEDLDESPRGPVRPDLRPPVARLAGRAGVLRVEGLLDADLAEVVAARQDARVREDLVADRAREDLGHLRLGLGSDDDAGPAAPYARRGGGLKTRLARRRRRPCPGGVAVDWGSDWRRNVPCDTVESRLRYLRRHSTSDVQPTRTATRQIQSTPRPCRTRPCSCCQQVKNLFFGARPAVPGCFVAFLTNFVVKNGED